MTQYSGMWTTRQQLQARAQNNWPLQYPPDAQFNYVSMLLTGDGTNGAQNNTFLDSSASPNTITRNGNTTQGSFSPYGPNWSNHFTGASGSTGARLVIPTTTNLNLTGDYTVECWYFQDQTPNPDNYGLIFGTSLGTVGTNEVSFFVDYPSTGLNWGNLSSGLAVTAGTWYHLAATKSATTTRFFVNGVLRASSTSAYSPPSGVNWYIGARPAGSSSGVYSAKGYVSNARIVKGTALYTANFTPPTAPLTAVSGTQLLTCQNNRFIDNSPNQYTITVESGASGAPSVQRFNPFGDVTYAPSTIGGSGYFDGSGDYLSVPYNANLELGASDFTIDGWINPLSFATNEIIISQWNTTGARSYYLTVSTAGVVSFATSTDGSSSTLLVSSASGAVKLNQWNHVRVSKTGTTAYVGVNGVIVSGTVHASLYSPGNNLTLIGAYIPSAPTLYVNGYLCDVRVIKGTALDTGATYTVPTAPLTAVANTSLLLNFTNAAIYDNAMLYDLETVGTAQISTSVKKYGTGSMYFDGDGDYLKVVANPNLDLGSGDFTIEAWIYVAGTNSNVSAAIVSKYSSSNTDWMLRLTRTGATYDGIEFNAASSGVSGSYAFSNNTWYYVAAVRSGSSVRLYVNGTDVGGGTLSFTVPVDAEPVRVGATGYPSYYYYWNGYIDDLRITKGYARYTTTFLPPTTVLPVYGPT